MGRFWLRLGPRFGGAADPGFTPRSRGFGANPENPPWGYTFFICLVPPLSRPLAIEPPALELQRGELAVVVGQRGVEVRIVHRRTVVVDGHEVDEACRGEKRLVNRDLSQAVGPSQVLHGVPMTDLHGRWIRAAKRGGQCSPSPPPRARPSAALELALLCMPLLRRSSGV